MIIYPVKKRASSGGRGLRRWRTGKNFKIGAGVGELGVVGNIVGSS